MAAITLVNQGTLNRLLTSLYVPSNPVLNCFAQYQGKRAIAVAFEGTSATFIPTQTGGVLSLEPYQQVSITLNLLKTQAVALAWRTQQETNCAIGNVTLYLDSVQFPQYKFINCAITGVPELTGAGTDADYMTRIMGYYPINAALYG